MYFCSIQKFLNYIEIIFAFFICKNVKEDNSIFELQLRKFLISEICQNNFELTSRDGLI